MIQDILYAPDSLNVILFHQINAVQAPLFQELALASAVIGKYLLFPLYLSIILLYLKYRGKTENIRPLLISMITAFAVYIVWVNGLKHLLHMPRPFVILPEGSVYIKDSIKHMESPFASLPSGHASFAMMMLVSLWPLLNTLAKSVGIAIVLWIGISRIALGVHFPVDIITSYILSLAITYYTLRLSYRFKLSKPLTK